MARFALASLRRFSPLLLRGRPLAVALGLLVACAPSSGPPQAPTQGRLELTGADGGEATEGPFRVVFSGPQGAVSGQAQISVVFSRPVRALELAGDETQPPFRLEPQLPGEWQPVGSRAYLFASQGGRLPAATAVRVTVPASFRALDGSTLGEDHAFEFETERPAVVQSWPLDGQRDLEPRTTFELQLNQEVEREEFQKNLELVLLAADGKSQKSAFSLEQLDSKSKKRYLLRPRAQLPAEHDVELRVLPTLRGIEGALPAGSLRTLRYRTYDKLRIESLTCSREDATRPCMPNGAFWLQLSTPVRFGDLKKHLVVDPPVGLHWESWRDDDDPTSYVDLNGRFVPGRTYVVRVAGELTDTYGQRLGAPYAGRLPIGDHSPTIAIGTSGDYFEPNAKPRIPIASVNVAEYTLGTAPLDLAEVRAFYEEKSTAQTFARQFAKSAPRRVRPTAAKNQPAQEHVEPTALLAGRGGRGPVFVGVRYTGPSGPEERSRIIQVTDLALSAKLSRAEASVVWVTELSSGKPVAGAEVRMVGPAASGQVFRTDSDGLARLPAGALGEKIEQQAYRTLIVVKKGDDWSYRSVGDYLGPWFMNVPVHVFGGPANLGLLFTERGIYRPGDTVQLKGIVRREAPGGNEVLAHRKFTLELYSPEWDVIETFPIETNAFGSFSRSIRLPATSSLGHYRLSVKELANDGDVSTSFQVAEYRPVEMQAKVSSDEASYVRGRSARFEITGDYLFGAPMAGAAVNYQVTRNETYFKVPQTEGFSTNAALYDAAHPEKAPPAGLLDSGEKTLDERGRLALSVPLTLPGQRSPELVSVDAEVVDVSRQTVASGSTAIVHPAEYYVGVQPLDPYFVDVPSKLRPVVLAAFPDGRRAAGKSVRLDLVHRRWTLVRETSGGSSTSEMRPLDEIVSSCTTTSTSTTASCELEAKTAGYYLILATSSDGKGGQARAAVDVYALGGAGGASFWRDDDAFRLELIADKKQYRPGDTARLLVKSPFQSAEALVTVEGDGVRSEQRVTLSGPSPTVRVPVTEAMRPNAYVSVHLVRPRTAPIPAGGKVDLGAPTYRVGYAELRVDPEARRLQVELRPNKTGFAPGETIDVDLKVKDGQGRGVSGEVTVYAVDEGVLSLIGYRTPDPIPVFTEPRPLRTATLESRESLGRVSVDLASLLGLGPSKGAEGGGGGEDGARRDFRQSAYFNPTVLTSGDGAARVSFRLPESLTTYRLMAVATSRDDRYGYTETRVTTSKKLMARPALPRLLRAGDSAQAGVVVSAKGYGPAEVTVELEAQGLEIEGARSQKIALPENGSVEARFALRAPRVGGAQLRFTVSGPGPGGSTVKDSVVVERRVVSPARLEAVALYGQTDGAVAEELGDLSSLRKDVGGLTLGVSSTALVGVGAGFEQLLDYPYGCTEQLTSRLLPLLPLRDVARDFAIPLPKNPDALIEATLAELLTRQRRDGGFGMWAESRESSPWISAYALFSLHQAKSRGFSLPRGALDAGRDYLRRQLAEAPRESRAAHPFFLYVLAEMGQPDPGYTSELFAQRAALPVFSRALLLHAMVLGKQPAADIAELTRELENGLRVEGNRAYFAENLGDAYAPLLDSPARTTALVLRALLAASPKHPLGARLARGLLDARDQGTWRSTQETAFALLALDAYRKAQESEPPSFLARVWSGERQLFETRLEGRTASAFQKEEPLSGLAAGRLVFEKQGRGTLFYEARLRYAKKALPETPLDRGFFVQKTYRAVTPDTLAAASGFVPKSGVRELPAGSLVLVDLVLVTPSPRLFTVLDDPLPAGLEAVDGSLSTSAAWTNVEGSSPPLHAAVSRDALAQGDAFLPSVYRRELRDDRVLFFIDHLPAGLYHYRYLARATTFGRFVVPPTQVEEMYTPEIFGRSAALTVDVR